MPTLHLLCSLLLATASLASTQLTSTPTTNSSTATEVTTTTIAIVTVSSTSVLPPYPSAANTGSATAAHNAGEAPYTNGTAGTDGVGIGGSGGVTPPVASATGAGFTGSAVKDKVMGACVALVGVCGAMLAL